MDAGRIVFTKACCLLTAGTGMSRSRGTNLRSIRPSPRVTSASYVPQEKGIVAASPHCYSLKLRLRGVNTGKVTGLAPGHQALHGLHGHRCLVRALLRLSDMTLYSSGGGLQQTTRRYRTRVCVQVSCVVHAVQSGVVFCALPCTTLAHFTVLAPAYCLTSYSTP